MNMKQCNDSTDVESGETGWVELDMELIRAVDAVAQRGEISTEAALRKCVIAGINTAEIN